jgi:hypothetical protein
VKNKAVWFIFLGGLIVLLSSGWNETDNSLHIFGLSLSNYALGQSKVVVLRYHFYDTLSWMWLLLMFTWGLRAFLFPLSNSHTVSQSLWLRLSPITSTELYLSRMLIVIGAGGFIFVLMLVLALAYHWIHQVALSFLMLPVIGMGGHFILAGALILTFRMKATTLLSVRNIVVLLFLLLPCMLYFLFHNYAQSLYGWFPYSAPLILKEEEMNAFRPFLTSGILGLLLLFLNLFLEWGKNISSNLKTISV